MLNFSHTLVIGLFFLLISSVALSQWGVLVAWRKRVKYPYVKKCALSIITPKAVSCNIKPGATFLVYCSMDQMFICDWL